MVDEVMISGCVGVDLAAVVTVMLGVEVVTTTFLVITACWVEIGGADVVPTPARVVMATYWWPDDWSRWEGPASMSCTSTLRESIFASRSTIVS